MHETALFEQIDSSILEQCATDSEKTPTLYRSANRVIQYVFWMRLRFIYQLMLKQVRKQGTCIDFGGGGGVFLPTLSKLSEKLIAVDLDVAQARKMLEYYQIENLQLVEGDVSLVDLKENSADYIIAADVLEHFLELDVPVKVIRRWLKGGGLLFTSLPTENLIYVLLRFIFRMQKPADHFHSAKQVEEYLSHNGFSKVKTLYVPFRVPFLPLFRVSSWKLHNDM